MELLERNARRWALAALAVGTVGLAACASNRPSGLDRSSEPPVGDRRGDMRALLERADQHWRRRTEPDEARRAVELYRRALDGSAGDWSEDRRGERVTQTHVRLARARFFLAEHIYASPTGGDSAPEQRLGRLHERGLQSAERAIARRAPDLAERLKRGDEIGENLRDSPDETVPALYWYALNLAKWGRLEGTATIMKHLGDIRAVMRFICDRRPAYFYGGCHRYFGAYWVSLPFGKKPARSRRHFEAALELAPNFLVNRVQMAKFYARETGDRRLFTRLLRKTVDARPAVDAIAPENELARRRASHLLDRTDAHF